MGMVASALAACVYRTRPAYYSELEELRCDMARLEKDMSKCGAYYKCSDTCWI